ncbi:LacI family DNA-binding transcriptional regulator [Anaerococcus cruorum]|uniref:LacI family DNA-binding transcriptional regulator n=1 Tax=Anaerococcus cruorum TaxID=3115617 RepID=A0ABW9MUZ0_9FIRM
MITLKEIAKQANVSVSTVSRVLNNDQEFSVKPETRQQILAIARENNYQRNYRKKYIINEDQVKKNILILVRIDYEDEIKNPFFSMLRENVENSCVANNFNYRVIHLENFTKTEDNDEIDGVIIIGMVSDQIIENIKETYKNVVIVGHQARIKNVDSVIPELFDVTINVIDHLLENGSKNIGFMGGKSYIKHNDHSILSIDRRYEAFKFYTKNLKVFDSRNVYITKYGFKYGYEAMSSAIAKGDMPDSFIIGNDTTAVGALKALSDANISVPNQIKIVSYDDTEYARYTNVPLSSVRIHTDEMAKSAIMLMNDRFSGREIGYTLVIPSDLMIRQSSVI